MTEYLVRQIVRARWFVLMLLLASTSAFAQEEPVQAAIRQSIKQLKETGQLQIAAADIAAVRVIPEFYERRNYYRAWIAPVTVADLLRAIDDSEKDGLAPQDYHRGLLHRLQSEIRSMVLPGPQKLADFDILLTDALLRLGYHLLFGKVDPERLDSNWNLARDLGSLDPATVIQDAIDSGALYEFVETSKPGHHYYTSLKEALARYRALANAGGWETVPVGETLKKGMTDARASLLRKRLIVTGDLPDTSTVNSDYFDEALEEAVKQFQARHFRTADGIVGKGTLEAMNVPVAARINQIRVNLERGRWVLHDLGDTFVIVNIAGFQILYINGSEFVWTSRVQVGKPFRKTPIFKSEIKYIVFNPTWTVPPTILSQDILPAVKRDPGYLQNKNMEVLDRGGRILDPATLDWSKYSGNNFPYILRQKAGPSNALGLVKFIFPNKHFVFLHDTPSKALFEQETRTFSSGCIRVEKPLELAELLLDDSAKWNQASIAEVIKSKDTRTVYLREPVSVLLLYWTASVDEDGRVNFINDVYERDAAILEDLNSEFRTRERDVIK